MKQFLQKELAIAPAPPVFSGSEKFFTPLPRRNQSATPAIRWHFTPPINQHPSAFVLVLTGLDEKTVGDLVLQLTAQLGLQTLPTSASNLDEVVERLRRLPTASPVAEQMPETAPSNPFFTTSRQRFQPAPTPFFQTVSPPPASAPLHEEELPLDLPTPVRKRLLDDIHQVIEGNLENEKFRVSDLAKALNCCIMQLHRIMKDLTGSSAGDYIRNYRLRKSLTHLQSGEHNVCEVADLVGFKSPEHFARCFRKAFGKSPSDCRCKK